MAPVKPKKRKSAYKIYYGDSDEIKYKIIGKPFDSSSQKYSDPNNMFDNDEETFYVTARASQNEPQGLEFDFGKEVEIAEIYILPVTEEENDYRQICLFTDEREDALFCSPNDYVHEKDQDLLDRSILFVHEFKKTYFRMTTRRLKLLWTGEGTYGRIRNFEIAYRYFFNFFFQFKVTNLKPYDSY